MFDFRDTKVLYIHNEGDPKYLGSVEIQGEGATLQDIRGVS